VRPLAHAVPAGWPSTCMQSPVSPRANVEVLARWATSTTAWLQALPAPLLLGGSGGRGPAGGAGSSACREADGQQPLGTAALGLQLHGNSRGGKARKRQLEGVRVALRVLRSAAATALLLQTSGRAGLLIDTRLRLCLLKVDGRLCLPDGFVTRLGYSSPTIHVLSNKHT
jgi:hypothetical protein